jgi:AcrR family transcriptional regulator
MTGQGTSENVLVFNTVLFHNVAVRTKATAAKKPRRYDSSIRSLRARETRAALMSAAAELFTTRGWAATGMRDVAAAAGVATETVYSHFASKRLLLQAVMDVAVVGDERSVAVAERDEFTALGRGRRGDRVAAAAALVRAVNERTAAYAMVLREAAPGDEQIAEMLQATRARQRQDVETGAALLIGRSPTTVEVDELWALLSPELYLLLVNEAGWTPAAYENWVATTLDRVVPRS